MSAAHTSHNHEAWPVRPIVKNNTGHPEPVLTRQQWEDISRIADQK